MLGDTFIRNFYTTYDYQSYEISLSVSSNAPAGVSITLTNLAPTSLSTGAIIGIVCGSLLLVVIAVLLIKYCRDKRSTSASFVVYNDGKEKAEAQEENLLNNNN